MRLMKNILKVCPYADLPLAQVEWNSCKVELQGIERHFILIQNVMKLSLSWRIFPQLKNYILYDKSLSSLISLFCHKVWGKDDMSFICNNWPPRSILFPHTLKILTLSFSEMVQNID